jgi:hypothetical protein
MLKSTCAVLAFMAMAFANIVMLGPALAQDVENEAESKECTKAILACASSAVGAGTAVASTIKECKALRECKKVCREEKRDCKKEARGNKKDCKDDCRDRYGKGKDYRDCVDNCRDEKKDDKGECKADKTDCKDDCRLEYKSPQCKAARTAIIGAGLATVTSCATAVQCITASEKEGQ